VNSKHQIKDRGYVFPKVSDDPLEDGLRILARIILEKIIKQRNAKKLSDHTGQSCDNQEGIKPK